MSITAKYRGMVSFGIFCLFSIHNPVFAARLPVGMNTNEIMQVDSSVPFVNLFKMALPFDEADSSLTHGNIVYDVDGWPQNLNGGQAGTNLIHWLPVGTLPEGSYTVLYDGEGTLQYGDDATVLRSSPGRDIIQIAAGTDRYLKVTLRITQTNTNNHLRNIRVLLPGGICANNPFKRVNSAGECDDDYRDFVTHHDSILFNPDYLAFMKDFKTLRFMNMSGITRNPLTSWQQMPRMSQATWAGAEGRRGAPLEVMVKLANQLNADAWFNIPHAADDHLVQQYADYVRQHLRPHLKAYVEYTNEAWNPVFTQAHYTKQMGTQHKLDTDPAQAGHKYYIKRSLEVFRLWQQTFGNTDRLVRVLGSWAANPKLSALLLSYGNAHQHTDALAIAPYFYVHDKQQGEVRTTEDIFRLLKDERNAYSIQNVLDRVQKQADIAKQYGIRLIAYEGGQHLVDRKSRSIRDFPNPQYIGANRAQPMEALYVEFLEGWQKITGNGLFVAFSAPRTYQAYGSWGIKEHINQAPEAAPKYRALQRILH
ncbi:MAG: hypothetical protein QJT81_10695 [Candidatus Thiothrix putei]|uniref:Cellulose-binding protein n=1 Tax=Candidatus Thiothrix putei TaxID=3080811 RepID=A0AA95HKH5_9GAMM|nr:MAG: hypothetical protein QJT81_10695 [Candidatus Thiothrix putei]